MTNCTDLIVLMTKTLRFSVSRYDTIWRNMPQYDNHIRLHVNLKSLVILLFQNKKMAAQSAHRGIFLAHGPLWELLLVGCSVCGWLCIRCDVTMLYVTRQLQGD
jgi:hypothetical protein